VGESSCIRNYESLFQSLDYKELFASVTGKLAPLLESATSEERYPSLIKADVYYHAD
jgi:hypothetical protein